MSEPAADHRPGTALAFLVLVALAAGGPVAALAQEAQATSHLAADLAWIEHGLAALVAKAEPFLSRWGYPAIAAIIALDMMGIPTPGTSILVAATIGAVHHDLGLPPVVVLAFGGAVSGSQAGYAIGRYGGRTLVRHLRMTPERLATVERRYGRWGAWVVLAAPFVDGLRQLSSFTAGLLDLPWWRFTMVNLLANAIWVAVWVGATWLVDQHLATLEPALHAAWPWLLVVAAALFGLLVWRRRRRHSAATAARAGNAQEAVTPARRPG